MAEDLVKALELAPHPYGGFFKAVSRSAINVKPLNEEQGPRSANSVIHFVMKKDDINPWHKLKSEEIIFFHKGCSLKFYLIDDDGNLESKVLGDALVDEGASFCLVIPAGVWFAAELLAKNEESYGFFSAAVTPGFHFDDSVIGHVDKLSELFPQHKEIIERLSIIHVHHDESPANEEAAEKNEENQEEKSE